MTKIGKEISKHIYIEFRYGRIPNGDRILIEGVKNKLWEEHGVIPNMDQYVDIFENIIRNSLKDKDNKDILMFKVSKRDFPFNTFFDEILIPVIILTDEEIPTHKGRYNSLESGRLDDGRYIVRMNNFVIEGNNEEDIAEGARVLMAHEITHAYDDYNRKENKADSIDDAGDKSGQFTATDKIFEKDISQIERMIATLVYYTNDTEINASVAQAREELKPHMRMVCDSESATEIMKKTNTYSLISDCQQIIEILNKLDKIYPDNEKSSTLKDNILIVFNGIRKNTMRSQFEKGRVEILAKSYHEVVKYLNNRFQRWKERFLVQVSKMIYDLYSANPKSKFDEGISYPPKIEKEGIKSIFKDIASKKQK